MRDAALPFIRAIIGRIEHILMPGFMTAVVVPRHLGTGRAGMSRCCSGAHCQQDFAAVDAALRLVIFLWHGDFICHVYYPVLDKWVKYRHTIIKTYF